MTFSRRNCRTKMPYAESNVLDVTREIREVTELIDRGVATIKDLDLLMDLVAQLDNRSKEWLV